MKYFGRWNTRWYGTLLPVTGIVLWEAAGRYAVVDPPAFLPPFSTVLFRLGSLVYSLELPRQLGLTLVRSFLGLAFALLIAVPIGLWIGYSKRASEVFTPTIEVLRPIPPAAIIPLAITFLGIDDSMKVAVILFGCIWPILINTIAGVRALDRVLIDTARTLKIHGVAFIWEVIFKGASPSIAAGVRISLAISLILGIVTEMIAGSNGLGFFIILAERSFRFADMYAGILAIGMAGYCLNWIFVVSVDRHLLRWHRGFAARV